MQVEAGKAGYGLVLALQVTVPCTRLTLVQSLSAEYPDHPRQMFRLQLSDIQTAVALEGGEQDIRSAAAYLTTYRLLFVCVLGENVKARCGLLFPRSQANSRLRVAATLQLSYALVCCFLLSKLPS